MDQMTKIREQQESLAKLHFELAASEEDSLENGNDFNAAKAQENMLQLMQRLEQLSISIEQLQTSHTGLWDTLQAACTNMDKVTTMTGAAAAIANSSNDELSQASTPPSNQPNVDTRLLLLMLWFHFLKPKLMDGSILFDYQDYGRKKKQRNMSKVM